MSITRADFTPANPSNVRFVVTFSRSVTGLDASDFELVASGMKGASITNISGTGASYTLIVNTGTGDGIIRLDLVDDDSIKDGSNNPLGGLGIGNGSYAGGETCSVSDR